jgi:hypothetical protein
MRVVPATGARKISSTHEQTPWPSPSLQLADEKEGPSPAPASAHRKLQWCWPTLAWTSCAWTLSTPQWDSKRLHTTSAQRRLTILSDVCLLRWATGAASGQSGAFPKPISQADGAESAARDSIRGSSPLVRTGRHGLMPPSDYHRKSNEETVTSFHCSRRPPPSSSSRRLCR